jgi:hypothetical protein
MKRLYEAGVWAIFSTLDPRVLQFKPGVLMTPSLLRGCLTASRSRSARRAADRPARPEAAMNAGLPDERDPPSPANSTPGPGCGRRPGGGPQVQQSWMPT